jgi:predicted PurR-regulated permease PerM
MYFVLRSWGLVATAAEDTLPLRPEHTRKLFDEFRRVGRATLLSTVVIGLLQAALATIGYWIVGLPRPLFFGALTAVASLVPGIGTLLVWLPAGVVEVLLGRTGSGVLLLVWGVVVISAIPEYVLRPRLVGRGGQIPSLFTFVALIGGAAVLGLKGLILGPVLMTMAITVLRLYAEEARARRHPEHIG